ncbi:MAG TPA: hypothetical protein VMV10_23285 [Pirellulales bacterium]|nr:hypothetical protein [Pirellulales bacterium]
MSQHNRRFWNAGQDGEIMNAVSELEIKLYKLESGEVAGHFKMSGSFGADFMDDDFHEPVDAAETARFARKLMGLFDGGRPPGACC